MLWRLAATRFLGKGRLQGFSTSTVVKIVEVGPRDGLQNERTTLSVDERVKFVDLLTSSGLPVVEVGSFVSPKWIPQVIIAHVSAQAIWKELISLRVSF